MRQNQETVRGLMELAENLQGATRRVVEAEFHLAQAQRDQSRATEKLRHAIVEVAELVPDLTPKGC
jgi:hypothetical protein